MTDKHTGYRGYRVGGRRLWPLSPRRSPSVRPRALAPVTSIAPGPSAPTARLQPVPDRGQLSRQGEILHAIVQGRPLDDVMSLISALISDEIATSRPSIVLLDAGGPGQGASVSAAPSLPTRLWPAIERQAIRTTLTNARADPGQEWRVVITPVIVDDPSWDEWRDDAAALGLVSSWSIAFVGASNAILGSFALYFAAATHPTARDLLALGDAAQLAAAAAQHSTRRQTLREQNRTNLLTGLPNRVVLLERLRTAQARLTISHGYFAVVQLAIDGLAQLKETLGAAAGDEVLRLAAQRLVRVAGTSATVAHIWGVEFAILVEDLESAERASNVAAAFGDACREPFDVEGLAVSVGATVGVVAYSQETAPHAMLRDAIEVIEPGSDDPTVLAPELRAGIEANELSMVYQPIIDLSTGALVRYEALLRWRNPRRGPIPPATFVHIAEQTGLVDDLGRYALREALAELARMRPSHPEVGISVNVSVRQLADERLPMLLEKLLDEHQFPRGSVTLEVTEGVLLRGGAVGWRVLAAMRDMGARIALDDFGTGFSQISYLRQFWFDEIKIDRSFVTSMMRDIAARAIIVGVIAVADYAGSEVVAEGVELPEQRAMLRELGAHFGQGYLFGAPGPIAP